MPAPNRRGLCGARFLPCALALSLGALLPAAGAQSAGTTDAAVPRAQALFQASSTYWGREFGALKASYVAPTLGFYSHSLPNACGTSDAIVGPFYCPDESRIYLPQEYLAQIWSQGGSSRELALAYVIGHEVGAHVQDVIGTTAQVEQARANSTPQLSARTWAVAELQADCYAGLWVRSAQMARQIAPGDAATALHTVAGITQAAQAQVQKGQVMPDPLQAYGSAEQRLGWFQRGLASGNFADCDTFAAEAAGKL